MTDWQTILTAAFIAAVYFGRPDWRLPVIWAGNFIATMNLAPLDTENISAMLFVAGADLVAAWFLLSCGARARVIAALYVAMIPIYIAGTAFNWPGATTYAIIDVLAFAQLAVVGNVDGGIRYIGRAGHRRLSYWRGALGRAALARHSAASAKEGRG